MTVSHLSAWKDIHIPNEKRTARAIIEMYMRQEAIAEDVIACFRPENAPRYGHKVIRQIRAADVLLEADRDDNLLRPFGMSQWQLAQALTTVLRTKYLFDKQGNIIDLAPKIKAVLAA